MIITESERKKTKLLDIIKAIIEWLSVLRTKPVKTIRYKMVEAENYEYCKSVRIIAGKTLWLIK